MKKISPFKSKVSERERSDVELKAQKESEIERSRTKENKNSRRRRGQSAKLGNLSRSNCLSALERTIFAFCLSFNGKTREKVINKSAKKNGLIMTFTVVISRN